uniref:Uncharacterized protein n=1 Tax=uncultured Chromatiales bacterium HF0200_41F04 TaxID=710740 RepID=E0XV48_9GAMM|nr:hypothetical protein [uncultured Chromatiales bacterium HF0200_41F04]
MVRLIFKELAGKVFPPRGRELYLLEAHGQRPIIYFVFQWLTEPDFEIIASKKTGGQSRPKNVLRATVK